MSALRLIPLGTNGFFASHGRQTMSFLLCAGDEAVLLDAGSGVGRLMEPAPAAALAGAERLTVLLTHYHLDHVVGLPALAAVWGDRAFTLLAPTAPLVDATPEEALERLVAPPLFPKSLAHFEPPVQVRPYSEGGFELFGRPVRVRRQRHAGGSAGLRIGDELAYITDAAADTETPQFVRGVSTLLHEVWLTTAEAEDSDPGASGHSSADQVAAIAREAEVDRLMPVHHHPSRDAAALDALVAELRTAAAPVEVVLPEEGRSYEVE